MNIVTQTSSQLVDIVAPDTSANAFNNSVVLIIVAVLTMVIVILFFWKRYHSKSQTGLRQLKRIQHELQKNTLSPRMASYRIAALYKRWLGLNHLPYSVGLPNKLTSQQSSWKKHLQRLHELRYSSQSCTEDDIQALITETRYWFKCWP